MPEIIILDTHVWLWYVNGNTDQYPKSWVGRIATARRVAVSPVSCFEIALAERRGRISLKCPVDEWFSDALEPAGVELFPLTPAIATRAVHLTPAHRDPFDRMIIATALEHGAMLASIDGLFVHYPELTGRLLK
ncbi:type II toxin-antitoxin system VapC family toxin [Candidatus Thiodictyon syntrophicum]|jgi:PIN domain nuclease of toxin-antitoxin system|uniref:Twitching motility protein PilT n=1 Tax=Candidatus Thiodictyon syntrophicum TaxID=1166950 RepID=A0A2K8UAW7_9GAMM|nr:type II toxin-antitoxin system VapC family toxin [Candidatus Thiodictyon syntrophicum]AUB82716.1 twitching motility protein PilT [Candidatus Thiodictyon syntrophicum]